MNVIQDYRQPVPTKQTHAKQTCKMGRLPHVKDYCFGLATHNLLHFFILAVVLDATWKLFHFCGSRKC
jgi:hypothetical protein